MKILREVTKWDNEYNIGGHIYHINDNGMLVAFDNGSGLVKFKVPKRFDRARRKFETVDFIPDELPPGAKRYVGSKGAVYIVTKDSCSCSGFKFRGKCKHNDNYEEL